MHLAFAAMFSSCLIVITVYLADSATISLGSDENATEHSITSQGKDIRETLADSTGGVRFADASPQQNCNKNMPHLNSKSVFNL